MKRQLILTKVKHFLGKSVPRSNFVFRCDDSVLGYTDKYTYLGIVLQEHLDYNVTSLAVSKCASRALGLLIAKYMSAGGFTYDVYTKLYNSLVWPVIEYGSAVWGLQSCSCINAVHNRAMRLYLGVGRYTSNAAVTGDMGTPYVRQWKASV